MLQELAPCACGTRCSCGGRCCGGAAGSLLFPVAAGYCCEEGVSVVDCTLSLGTPSTRRAQAGSKDSTGRGVPARRCANCDTTSTPLWRNGPRGPKSLCNACGIRYKKEERRAAAATQDAGFIASYACGAAYARQQHQHQQPPPQQQLGCYGSSVVKSASFAAYGDNAAADGPCLSLMFNVMPSSPAFAVRERPTLFEYY